MRVMPAIIGLALPFSAYPAALTFAHDIAPVIYQHCSSCHRPGEAGPFPLLRYEDVKKRARQIAEVVQSRYMPPWLPDSGHGDFADTLRLSDTQVRLIADW